MSNASSNESRTSTAQPKRCVAWGEVEDPWNKAVNASDTVLLREGDQAVLPHIDSCLGLVFKLKDNRVFCAHVSLMPKPTEEEKKNGIDPFPDANSSLQRAFAEVSRAVSQNEILSVTGIGPGDDWSVELRAFSENAKFVRTDDYRNGVDVTVNHDGSFEVEAYKG